MLVKMVSLVMAALLAGIYCLPLCPNIEMLAGGKIDPAMCVKSCCAAAEESAPAPTCCDTTVLTLDRRDGVSVQAPTVFPPALAPAVFQAALELAPIEFLGASASVLSALPPPLSLPLRL